MKQLAAVAAAAATALAPALAAPTADTSQNQQPPRTGQQQPQSALQNTQDPQGTANGQDPAEITDVQLVHHAGFDTVRVEFAPGSDIPQYQVGYQPRPLRMEGSGKPANLAGAPGPELAVELENTRDRDTPAGAELGHPEHMPSVAQTKNLGSFEGHVKLGVALPGGSTPPVSVSTGGNSISINIDYGAPEQPRARDCGNVGFVPASDAGAFNIAARGVNCGTARDVAAYAEGEHGEPYGTASGYSCLPERDNSGALPVTEYTCTRGEATVTFET